MEHVLYASLLEDTPMDLADEGFAKCEQDFFDWNEVRVTTVTELAEVLSRLPNPVAASVRLKKNLQSMFEAFYNFDLDYLKKENLGKAVAKFEAMPGMSPFVLSYLVQHGLGGHAIPIDKSSMKLMWLTGIVSDAEAESGKVPGLERTIPKNKSIEFSSLLHQSGVVFQNNSKDKSVWDVLLSVNKDAKALFDRPVVAPPKVSAKVAASKVAATAASAKSAKSTPDKKSGGAPVAEAKSTGSGKAKSATEKLSPAKPVAAKGATKPDTKTEKPKLGGAKPVVSPASSDSKPLASKMGAAKAVADKTAPAKKSPPATSPVPQVKATPESAKKPSVKKSESTKPLSAKSSVAKPSSAKSPGKPASKKTSESTPVPEKKGVASTNKKLTKQKPR